MGQMAVSNSNGMHPQVLFYLHKSLPVGKAMFVRLYGISDTRFRSLEEYYEANGIAARTHGNTKRLTNNTILQTDVEAVSAFIVNYPEENAIELPGRVPGYKNDDIKPLPFSESKANVRHAYKTGCGAP